MPNIAGTRGAGQRKIKRWEQLSIQFGVLADFFKKFADTNNEAFPHLANRIYGHAEAFELTRAVMMEEAHGGEGSPMALSINLRDMFESHLAATRNIMTAQLKELVRAREELAALQAQVNEQGQVAEPPEHPLIKKLS